MNIIITSAKDTSVTNVNATDLDTMKIFISKALSYQPETITLQATVEEDTLIKLYQYEVSVIRAEDFDKQDYIAYTAISSNTIPLLTYTLTFTPDLSNEKLVISDVVITNELVDEHEIVMINGRNINPITTPIVAGDRGSQEIRFSIYKKYDGVSVLDHTKEIWVDYIPPNFQPPEDLQDVEFYSSRIAEMTEEGMEEERVCLKWKVPDEAMAAAGVVQFAIVVLQKTADKKYSYIWQTFPSSFTVSPYLGRRLSLPVEAPEDISEIDQLIEDVAVLKTTTENLNELLGYQADAYNNDVEAIVGGGGAPIDTEGETI